MRYNIKMRAFCEYCGIEVFVRPKGLNVCMSCLSRKLSELREFAKKYRYESTKKKPAVNYNLPPRSEQSFRKLEKLEEVNRECLKCELDFIAEGRYHRICFRCKPKTFKQPWEEDGF